MRVTPAACCLLVLVGVARSDEPPKIYNQRIRPILADNCFACHGADSAARKADLRLDQRASALELGSIVPGKPDESELIRRIESTDPNEMMPPPASKKTLTAAQKATLKSWIAAGGEYEPHWSLISVPDRVPVPQPMGATDWARNPIDHFVFDRLQHEGLKPAPEASRETWLRRVTFDLTGLPPTLAELDAFLADNSPDAYERVVERLLHSPAYGEKLASDWLDVSRYADTFGYQADRDTHLWPWRDWVLRAFNTNLSYDKFILWQLAGDLLDEPTRDQRLATAFNRLHRQTNEGGSIEEEFRIEYIADRVRTTGTAFLALTLECCRCHDHKFDPVSQREYYQFSAFFNNIDEHGLYSHFTEAAPTPALLLYEGDQETRHLDVLRRIREKADEVRQIAALARRDFEPGESQVVTAPQPTKTFAFEDAKPAGDYKVVAGRVGQGLEFGGDDPFTATKEITLSRVVPFSLGLWVRPAVRKPRMIVLHRSVAAEDAAFRGYSLVIDDGHPTLSLVHFWPGNAIRIRSRLSLPESEWTHLTMTYDGSSQAAGLKLYINGVETECDVVRDRLTRDITYRSEWGDSNGGDVPLQLGARFRDVGFQGGVVDELTYFDRELTGLETSRLYTSYPETKPADAPAAPHQESLVFEQWLKRSHATWQTANAELLKLRAEENELVAAVRQIMVMREMPEPRPAYILNRGQYDARGAEVHAATPAAILPFDNRLPKNRLGLARWLLDPQHPLTSRVAVNRFWQMFFGRGLVASADDFGVQGQTPTHPELLDWLARSFQNEGWDLHKLCRMIVLSSTYRQSSTPESPALYATDPDNRLLARGPRHRLSAEEIRDNALAVSGLLKTTLGGPSVMPYQPAGLWEESGTGKVYRQSHGDGLYRRSLYTFWRRTSPPPGMTSFDAPNRELCLAKRERTSTPLQALVLLNDPQYVEAARVLAEKLLKEHPRDLPAAITQAFRLATSRLPSEREAAILKQLHDEQLARFSAAPAAAEEFLKIGETPRDPGLAAPNLAALTALVQGVLNLDECVTKR